MRRREFTTLIGGVATWPLAAVGQQSVIPVIGLLASASADGYAPMISPFQRGLAEKGYIVGQNVAIEYRWAENQVARLPELAADLVRRNVAVIFAATGVASALAAKAATTMIPIVFSIGADPVKFGLVASLNRPGGNITGVSSLLIALVGKRLGLLRELAPKAQSIGFLVNSENPNADSDTRDVQESANASGQQIQVVNANTEADIESAFVGLIKNSVDALLVASDPFLFTHRYQIATLAAKYAIPTIYDRREAVTDGGLISYGASFADVNRQAGNYVGRILKGEKASDLPVLQPTKFELVINLKAAKSLGLSVPQTLLVTADEVIE
jgi:putative tryptophan/tyrosine transport system substrate-binding protein